MMGTDITYKCLGGNKYVFTVTAYRDCVGVPISTTKTLTFSSATCGQNFSVTIARDTFMEVSEVCPTSLPNTTCANTSNPLPGTQAHIYSDTVTLPAQCADWDIYWSECCRNGAITNLQTLGDFFVKVTLNNTNGICNNSPQYTALPTPYICVGQQFQYNHGAWDVDNDSLYYRLAVPLEGPYPGTPYLYNIPYTMLQPVQTVGGFNFNNFTGTMCFIPSIAQMCVVSVIIEEWRQNVKIAEHIREMQIVVAAGCTNQSPRIIGSGNCTGGYGFRNVTGGASVSIIDSNSISMCPGDSVCFEIWSMDPDGNNITVSSNVTQAIPNATFTTNCVCPTPISTFCWKPTVADSGYHIFTVKLVDDACPIKGSQFYTFDVLLWLRTDAGGDKKYCIGGVPTQLNAVGGTSFTWSVVSGDPMVIGSNFSCNPCASPLATPTSTTVYAVKSDLQGSCKNTDTVMVTIVPDFTMTISPPDTICLNESATVAVYPDSSYPPYTVVWTPGSTLADPSAFTTTASPSSTTRYKATVTSSVGCVMADSVNIKVFGIAPIVAAYTDPDTVCSGDSVQLTGYTVTASDNFDVVIDSGYWEMFTFTGIRNNGCGNANGSVAALWFNTPWNTTRAAETVDMDVTTGGDIRFWLIYGDGVFPCEDVDPGKEVILEYSTNGGVAWTLINTYPVTLTNWTHLTETIPVAAQTASTRFRWSQLWHNGTNWDNWALDEVMIGTQLGLFTYEWSPATGLTSTTILNPSAFIPATITYTLNATSVFNQQCIGTDDVTVYAGPRYTLSSTPDTAICYGDAAQLYTNPSLPGTYTYDWRPYYMISDSSIQNPVATPLGSVTYSVRTANPFCVQTDTVELTVTGQPIFAFTDEDSVCAGDTVNLDVAIGKLLEDNMETWDYTKWSTYWNCTFGTTCGSVSGNALYFDWWGTRQVQTIDLDVTAGGSINFYLKISNGAIPCEDADPGEDVVMEYSLNGGFTWTNMATYNEAGYPNFTFINQPIPPLAKTSSTRFRLTQITHSGWQNDNWAIDDWMISTGGKSGKFYSWTPTTGLSDANAPDPSAVINSTITYVLSVQDSANMACFAYDTVTIYAGPNFTLNTTPDTGICFGSSAQLYTNPDVAGTYTYKWSPSTALSGTNIFNPVSGTLSQVTYSVQVSNAFCERNDDVTVMVGGAPVTATVSDDSICPGDTVQLDATIGGTIFDNFDPLNSVIWSSITGGAPGASCGSVSGNALYFNGAGVRQAATVDLAIITGGTIEFFLKVGNGPAPCEDADPGENIVLEYSTDGGFSWFNIATYNEAGFPIFSYIIQPIPAGAMTGSTRFRVRQLINSGMGMDNWAIEDFAVNTTGVGGYQFAWTPGATLSDPTIANPAGFPLVNQTYIITVTDTFGCINRDTVPLAVGLKPVITMSPDTTICWGYSVQLTGIGVGGISYLWTPSAGLSSATTPVPVASPTVTTTYTVEVTNVFGCINSDTVRVTVRPQPNITLTPNTTICLGDSLLLTATGGVNYSWSPATGLSDPSSSSPMSTPLVTTTYSVSVTDAIGCINVRSVTVTVRTPLDLVAGPDEEICDGESILLSASGAVTYNWTPAAGLSNPAVSNPIATPNITTTYMVIGSDGQCAPDTEYVTVTVNPPPPLTLGPDVMIIKGESVQLNAVTTGTITWAPGTGLSCTDCPDPIATPEQTTVYVVAVVDSNGCVTMDTITVVVKVEPCIDVFIPNAFTPDDVLNNIFYIRGPEDIHIKTFAIFNRWGDKIFEANNFDANDPAFGWDGTYKGQRLSPAVFAYYVEGMCKTTPDKEPFYKKGNITILK